MKLNYALEIKEYTIENALLWGNFKGHCAKIRQGSLGSRVVHLMIAAVELLPLISQIASLAEKFIVTYLSNKDLSQRKVIDLKSSQNKMTASTIASQATHNKSLTEEELIQEAEKTFHIRKNKGPNFQKMFNLYVKLFKGSQTYRDIVKSIEQRNNQSLTLLDRKTAIEIYEKQGKHDEAEGTKNYQFPACWDFELNAVIIMEPDTFDEHHLGAIIAFETTNGYQGKRFDDVDQNALAGKYRDSTIADESVAIERAARQFAFDNEKIEQDGLTIAKQIISEAEESKEIDSQWFDFFGKQKPEDRGKVWSTYLSEYGQKHIGYYEKHYIEHLLPLHKKNKQLQQKFKASEALSH